jgi:hypothetical protein
MVGIIQCSRIYCKRMSSKGLISIRRRVAVRGGGKNFTKLGQRVTVRGGAWWPVVARGSFKFTVEACGSA